MEPLIYLTTANVKAYLYDMSDSDAFTSVFGNSSNVAYDQRLVKKIGSSRQALENNLFIDRLLKALGIEHRMSKLYICVSYSLIWDLLSIEAIPSRLKS